jgi:hypothetical protein
MTLLVILPCHGPIQVGATCPDSKSPEVVCNLYCDRNGAGTAGHSKSIRLDSKL